MNDPQLIELIRDEHNKTGRKYGEIIQSMWDEGYLSGTLEDMNELLGEVAPGHTDLMVSPEAIDKYLEENPPSDLSDGLPHQNRNE